MGRQNLIVGLKGENNKRNGNDHFAIRAMEIGSGVYAG